MRPVHLAIWIGIAFLLASHIEGGTEVCHSPLRTSSSIASTVVDYVITNDDVEVDPTNPPDFNVYYHPFGETTTETRGLVGPNAGRLLSRTRETGPVWEDSCGIGDNENAGYQLKIFSKQDPKTKLFDKPILVTQGFDASYRTGDQFNFDKFKNILNRVFENEDTDLTKRARDETSLLKQLYEEGYDIALLLWKNPNIDIRTNALVTLQALRWLQKHTDTMRGGTEPVIIGPSLGGLVTRYALQLAGCRVDRCVRPFPPSDFSDIRARLFIAFDSPNLGAEIPMSLQALASYFRDRGFDQERTFKNLTSTAGRQLLLSSVLDHETGTVFHEITNYEATNCQQDNDLACVHGKFMGEINNPDFRAQIKNIIHPFAGSQEPIYTAAIINGSGAGMELRLPEGATYLHMSHFTLGVELRTASANERVRVTHADRAFKDALNYDFKEPVFMEDTPGGLRPTYSETRKSLEDRGYSWNISHDDSVVNHAFIPSLSGVGGRTVPFPPGTGGPFDITDLNDETNWFTAVGQSACTVGGSPLCMFDQTFTPVSNQRHVTVTRENKQWFLDLIHTYGPQELTLQRVKPFAAFICAEEPTPRIFPRIFPLNAFFGYDNPNTFNVTIPIGANNRFTGQGVPEDLGQPETFFPGEHFRAFHLSSTVREGDNFPAFPAWTLDGATVQHPIPESVIFCFGIEDE